MTSLTLAPCLKGGKGPGTNDLRGVIEEEDGEEAEGEEEEVE